MHALSMIKKGDIIYKLKNENRFGRRGMNRAGNQSGINENAETETDG